MPGSEHNMAGMAHMHAEVPQEYANLTNPLAGDAEATDAGKIIFETNCAACHGPEGQVVNYLRIFAAQAHHTAPEPDETGGY